MAKRIKLGRHELPIYALGGYVASAGLLSGGAAQGLGTSLRVPLMVLSIIAFLAGVAVHTFDKIDHKIDQHNLEMLGKIEDSVGDVWDSGERAGVRHQTLRQMERHNAVVRSDTRLAVVPDSDSC